MFRARRLDANTVWAEADLSPFQRRRLLGSWVYPFRDQILPLVDEHAFAPYFHAGFGAPNRSISLLVGILLLKDYFDLTDKDALEHFAFDRRWHIALDVLDQDVSCCQKTLHNFRVLLRQHDKARWLFEQLSRQLVALLGIDCRRQRLDSTHCQSNVALLKRLAIFCESMRLFLRRLQRCQAEDFARLPEQLRRRYHTDQGRQSRYHGTSTEIARRRLAVVARDLFRLIQGFQAHPLIAAWSEFATLQRVLAEQCDVLSEAQSPQPDDDDVALGPVPVRVRVPKEVPSSSLQTPHDPDVTYGKKGQGYEVQVCETFGNKSVNEPDKPELITHIEVTPSCQNDVNVTVPILEALKAQGLQPSELEVDSNFTSSEVIEAARQLGTEVNGPVKGSKSLPQPGDITVGDFQVDVAQPQNSRCPAGQRLSAQTLTAGGRLSLAVVATVCAACGVSSACPSQPGKARQREARVVKTTLEEINCARRRRYETTPAFRDRQRWRAGIEATNSELKRSHGLGKLSVRGQQRVRMAVYLKGLACNVKRVVRYLGKHALVGGNGG